MDASWALENAWIIPLLPLAAAAALVAVGARLGERASLIGIAAVGGSFALSAAVFLDVLGGLEGARSYHWLTIGAFDISFGFQVGNLEAVMLFVVALVAWMVQIYSKGYMHGDARFNRYFTVVNLFTAAMLALIMADNFLLFLIAWEIMGLCSYLLIGHYFEDLANAKAAMKAFMTTRVGDVGLMLGIWLLFVNTGTFNFAEIGAAVAAGALGTQLLVLIGLLLFMGTVGKSAQVPLHVWLPDAMAGPTPVSALIHAATMVAAGVFLVARAYPIFLAAPAAMEIVAVVGAVTAIFAATIAVLAVDIKRVLAYSTISQLGYMVLGLGIGGYAVGLFHLLTHAFFKALLFLGSGSVIHAVHTQNLHEMGGLFKKMKITGTTFIIGALALAGIPPLAGFYSKDGILLLAYQEAPLLFILALAAAFLTAFYMTRCVWLCFFGKPRDREAYEHAHESPPSMTVPLVVLAGFALIAGFPPGWFESFVFFEAPVSIPHPAEIELLILATAVSGIVVGYLIFGAGVISRGHLIERAGPLYRVIKNKYYFDEAYHAAFVVGGMQLVHAARLFDTYVIDGLVNGIAFLTGQLSALSRRFDQTVVDGIVNGVGAGAVALGDITRRMVTGQVQVYIMVLFAAVLAALALYWAAMI